MNRSKGKARPQTSNQNRPKNSRKPPVKDPQVRDRGASAPVAQAKVMTTQKQRFNYLPNGDCVITHREYLTDIPGSVAFAATSTAINPGLVVQAPWLSAIAQRYESYRYESLRYLFETEQATSSTGTVMLVVDYDASDSAPTSKTQALSYRDSVRSPPWAPCKFTASKEDLNKQKSYFVRGGTQPANTDIKLYDVGNLYVCTIGQANTNTIGELYVEYVVRLMTPQMGDAGLGEALFAQWSGTTNSAPFGTLSSGSNLPATRVSSGTTTSVTTWTFQEPFEGIISYHIEGTTLIAEVLSGTASYTQGFANTINGANTGLTDVMVVKAAIGQTLIITQSNATISNSFAIFTQYDNAF